MEIKPLIAISLLLIITSCSSTSSLTDKTKIYKKFNEVSKNNPIKIFNRKELDYLKYPLIEVQTNGILKQALMLPISRRDNYINYWSGSGQSITMNGSVISKTNGININLLSVELDESSPLLHEKKPHLWPAIGNRNHSYLNHLNEINNISFKCNFVSKKKETITIVEIEYELTKILEECKSEDRSFINKFWVDSDGFIWKSDQWLDKQVVASVSVIKSIKEF